MLDKPPTLFQGGNAPASFAAPVGEDGDGSPPTSGKPGSVTTTERSDVRPLSEVLGEPRLDDALYREMAEIAARLGLRRRVGRDARRGRSHPASARFDGNADEVDLDRTMELLIERRALLAEEIFVRRPVRSRRSIALLADVSGSMDGEKARLTAATVGALAGELVDDELTVIAFWKDVALLRVRAVRLDPASLVSELIRIEPKGLTNVHGAIELAVRELAKSPIEKRRIVLLSDCVHNAGPDPIEAARVAPPTLVLLEQTDEYDAWIAERIARVSGGRVRTVRHTNEVAPALSALLAD